MNSKRLVMSGLLIAMHVVLCYVSINLGNMDITLSGFPIIVGAMCFGPITGLEIGLIGSFLNQMLKYGFTATTILWIIPAGFRGLAIGAYAKRNNYHLKLQQMAFIIISTALIVTAMNTLFMYIDSKVYGYYSFVYVFGSLPARILSSILTSIVYLAVTPSIMKHISFFRKSITV